MSTHPIITFTQGPHFGALLSPMGPEKRQSALNVCCELASLSALQSVVCRHTVDAHQDNPSF